MGTQIKKDPQAFYEEGGWSHLADDEEFAGMVESALLLSRYHPWCLAVLVFPSVLDVPACAR